MEREGQRCLDCVIDEYAMERACAPEQPQVVVVGSEWMRLETGTIRQITSVEDGCFCFGGSSHVIYLRESQLRREWVCVDPPPLPDNVVALPDA